MFTFLYYLLALILHILAIPFLLYKARNKKYKDAIPAKFFLKNNPNFKDENIWFHTCSMGETRAIKPILDEFDEVNLSVITNTGYEEALKYSQNVRYLPFETLIPFWITKQKMLVVMEAELWYLMFLFAKTKGTKTVLINARISDKSYESYKKVSFLYKRIFQNIDKVFAQNEIDKKRLEELGASNVEVIGNIKLANLPKVTFEYKKPNCQVVTAGSTHESEEEIIFHAWDKSMGKLIIVPRHPERFDVVSDLLDNFVTQKGLTYHRWSEVQDFSSDIILVDVMGELNNIYNISDVVILGGGFIKTAGGHNPIEPAYFGCKLISGDIIFNQKSLFECVENGYLIQENELSEYLKNIENLKPARLGKSGNIEPIIQYIKENSNG
jgi:3-deoxy-D-manno-octulosonic-acid transferase